MNEILNNVSLISMVINLIGTIAIIATLVYLIKQVSVTNNIAKGDTEREMFDSYNEILYRYSDPESLEILRLGFVDYYSMTKEQQAQFCLRYMIPHLNNVDSFFQLYKKGLISRVRLFTTSNIMIATIKTKGGGQCWEQMQHVFNPEFTAFLNEQIKGCDHIPPLTKILEWTNQ